MNKMGYCLFKEFLNNKNRKVKGAINRTERCLEMQRKGQIFVTGENQRNLMVEVAFKLHVKTMSLVMVSKRKQRIYNKSNNGLCLFSVFPFHCTYELSSLTQY